MNDLGLKLMTGVDIPVGQLQLTMHQPKVKDIAFMSESKFFSASQYLCFDKEQTVNNQQIVETLTNFQILMKVIEQSDQKNAIKQSISTLLLILFPSYRSMFTPQSLVLINLDDTKETHIIDNSNFEALREVAVPVLCLGNNLAGKNMVYNPVDDKAKRIAQKIYEGRRKVAQQRAEEEGETSILARYVSVLSVGLHLTPEECSNYTLYQLFDQMERYNMKIAWDIDLKVRLTGTQPKTETKNWMDNIH